MLTDYCVPAPGGESEPRRTPRSLSTADSQPSTRNSWKGRRPYSSPQALYESATNLTEREVNTTPSAPIYPFGISVKRPRIARSSLKSLAQSPYS